MRNGLIAVVIVVVLGALGFGAWRVLAPSQPPATVASTAAPAPADTTMTAAPEATGAATETPEATPSASDTSSATALTATAVPVASSATPAPGAAASGDATPAPSASPSASPTVPAEPTGLPAQWAQMTQRTEGGPEADLLVRTGDINNLGYGWPKGFTPFSGQSTPPHPYPCEPRAGAAPGTDRIMLGTSVTASDIKTKAGDGYSSCSSRPDNLPEAIPLAVGALPNTVHVVLVQMFLDDFQSPVWHSRFQVSLNGTRIPTFENTIDTLNQTGPIGKLVTLRLLPEYVPLLRSGTVNLLIDDPTTHAPDGYAVDFVRILVNPHAFRYAVTIACTVVDADTQKPISGATVSAAQVTESTGADGKRTLIGVPAGLASVEANAVGYDSAVQLVDLPAGTHGEARFELHRHSEGVADLQRSIAQNGSAAIYGIHFDTASATLRPDSIASLETVLQLIKSSNGSHWIIAGHTDNEGGADYNLELSVARAKSVVAWLGKHGIAADRLVAQGFGLTRPVGDNGTASGRALNRRVEVKPSK